MQETTPLNRGWLYKPSFSEKDRLPLCLDEFETVDLPHTNRILPYNYLDERDYQFVSCYVKKFPLPPGPDGRDVFLDFEGVSLAARVYCNGALVREHKGGYTPFSAELTPHIRWNAENCVVVEVDSTERADIPPCGNMIDYLTYGGIYREVQLRLADPVRIESVRLTALRCLSDNKGLAAELELSAPASGPAVLTLGCEGSSHRLETELPAGLCRKTIELNHVENIQLWDLDAPALYTVTVELEAGGIRERRNVRFGFRESRFAPDGYYLNGRRLPLVGLNRHQSYPYVGYAMPSRVQQRDAELLKEHAGINVVRTSHYPQSRHFLDRCDELGLLVAEEISGWQHIGDAAWQKISLQEEAEMIRRDWNRPCVILWGVRINESQDDHGFYTRTNALAHESDPSRPTGGVRYIQNSELLEDVYTYNDFTYNGQETVFRPQRETTGLNRDVPTLVTESNGHMYPTKRFDQEARQVEHALRHLRVMDESIGRADLAGGISWCAFDYNTHASFGSGDKICYHGVYDMFRNPKFAAFSYASQKDAAKGIVLEPITLAARGERDGVGIVPFYVLTNCDFVRVYKNETLVGDFTPDRARYPHLPHPPVRVAHLLERSQNYGFSEEDQAAFRTFLGERLEEGNLLYMREKERGYLSSLAQKYGLLYSDLFRAILRAGGGWGSSATNILLEGYVDGKAVCRRFLGEQKSSAGLVIQPDDDTLYAHGDTYDATRVTVQAVDNFGNLMPFTQECVEIQTTGPVRVLGPSRFALSGGSSAFWIRTLDETGPVCVKALGISSAAECHIQIL